VSYIPDRTLDHLRKVTEEPDLSGTRYRLDAEIGRGGMGIVYRAWDGQLDRPVALKVIDSGPPDEPRTLARLEHPGLVPVYDSGLLPDGRLFYAMRLVEGRHLDDFLGAESSLPARLRVFEKICEAVAFAHDRGVVHCDLKPRNIMIGAFGEVLVMDWGIARAPGEPTAAATPHYGAPEAIRDVRSDIYSLGRILEDMLPAAPPRPLSAVVRRAAAADPGSRYAAVADLTRDITRFLDGVPVSVYRDTAADRVLRFARNNRMVLLLLATWLVVKFALIFFRNV
jgi:serine/threonine protein kinase